MTISTQRDTDRGWRTIDIVVAAVVAVAFGAVFLAWNTLWLVTEPFFRFFAPIQAVLYGVWLLPGVLVGLIIRRPGAAFFGNFVAAGVSVLLGSPYGGDALVSGAIQGIGAEAGFALTRYRVWSLPTAVLAGALAGVAAAIHDIYVYYPTVGPSWQAAYLAFTVVSGAAIAGAGAWLLVRTLVARGVLAEFAVGREQEPV